MPAISGDAKSNGMWEVARSSGDFSSALEATATSIYIHFHLKTLFDLVAMSNVERQIVKHHP